MQITWQYVAGLFDGEGYVGVQVGGKAVSAKWSIAQSGKQGELLFSHLIPWLRAQGVKVYLHGYQCKDPRFQKKWAISGHTRASVNALLQGIFPYLIVKKLIAQDILRFLKVFPKLSTATRTDGKAKWEKRVRLYGPSGNRCGLYAKQIGKTLVNGRVPRRKVA